MQPMKRYAIYYAPEPGAFADAAAGWLGWDPALGCAVSQPGVGLDLASLTTDPRKYGFHGTLKAPFRLADGVDVARLTDAVATLAQTLPVVELDGLQLLTLSSFLALTPTGDTTALLALAANVVERLDPLRARLTPGEIARRRPERLSARQRDLLDRFGYPYVMEEFQFHLTLSNQLSEVDQLALQPLAQAYFAACLPQPFRITDLCLFGEADSGRFHLLARYRLG